jgi:hypothetical protein
VSALQGLCIIPRVIGYDNQGRTLTRITETWLVGQGSDGGPRSVHQFGLWIGLGLRENITSFKVGFGARDGAVPSAVAFTTPSGDGRPVESALRNAFGGGSAQWNGFHLTLDDLPPLNPLTGLPTWTALFFEVVSAFHPNKRRDFHVVPVVVAIAAGANVDTFADSHYLLGLTVFNRSWDQYDANNSVEDFMVVTQAMRWNAPHPGLIIPGPLFKSPSKPRATRPEGRRRPAAPDRRKKSQPSKAKAPARKARGARRRRS